MNRVCSLIVALALMSSVLMAQTSPTVPLGHWVYDSFKELEEAGVVNRPSGVDANTAYTRDQAATMIIKAMGSIRSSLDALPTLPNLSLENKALVTGTDRERYQVALDVATLLSKQATVVSKLSCEFQAELAECHTDINESTKLCSDTEKVKMRLRIALFLISLKQDEPEVPVDHWAYSAIRSMMADGLILGYQMVNKDEHINITKNQFARMTMSVPAVLTSRVAEHECSVNRWCDEMSQDHPDAETEAKLLSERVMLSQHNVTLVALCYEFSAELQALGFDPASIKKSAIDIQARLNKSARVMNSARSAAMDLKYVPLITYRAIDDAPFRGSRQENWSKMPLVGIDFDQFWRNFRYSQ